MLSTLFSFISMIRSAPIEMKVVMFEMARLGNALISFASELFNVNTTTGVTLGTTLPPVRVCVDIAEDIAFWECYF